MAMIIRRIIVFVIRPANAAYNRPFTW